VDKVEHEADSRNEVELATDLLAGLLMEQSRAQAAQTRGPERLTARIYATMAVTTLLTFATLTMGYQLLFSHQLFA
jgi:hypothetical protein